MRIEVIHGDITRLPADAVVNAANTGLLGGGGVDGAIHRRAGPRLFDECARLPEVRPGVRCPTGEVRVTSGFDLPARYIIHTVGPVWRGGGHGEALLLEACYRHSLDMARALDIERIVFPAISCGVYAYPPEQAARIAVTTIASDLDEHDHRPGYVLLCCFTEHMQQVFQHALDAHDAAGT
ncbi:MAG TPA: O-acetyl-ADP-ribose deacetylase [Oleiagrimonas sp.]|nr:O-acetyl-ADP-ribose deacetylase [Oleiagrimonas sp.]